MLNHIAIIPDGNRRWAKRRKVSLQIGYKTGRETTKRIFEKALELKIPYLTFWLASWDNITNRPKKEVNFLIKLITEELQKSIEDKKIKENKVRIRVLGRFNEVLSPKILKIIKNIIKKTQNHNLFHLTFLLAYNGTDEMLEAIKKIIKFNKKRKLRVTGELIKKFLWTGDLPPVDLVIRTGCEGDPHNSAGFMMWQTAYSQYYFTQTLYPDFTTEEFEKAIRDYSKRERRYGG